MEMVNNGEMLRLKGSWCIPIFNPGFYLHVLVNTGYFQLLMMLGVPSDLPAVS